MNFYNKSLNDFKENYILFIPLTIIFQSCLGGIAAMFILMNSTADSFNFIQLTLCVIFAMGYNAVVYAQLSSKLIFNVLIATIFIEALLLIINVIQLL